MRNAEEMERLIRGWAEGDDRVRALILNGSRANPDARADIFQDYDVAAVVSALAGFLEDRRWIEQFGPRIIMQTPDELGDPAPDHYERFAFLMLFCDGNRLDLTLYPRGKAVDVDERHVIWLDKDGTAAAHVRVDAAGMLPKPPTSRQYAYCCNEFWWVSTYIAKGLARRELPYAKAMFDGPVRKMLNRMVTWWIGVESGFAADPGKMGRYFEKHLAPHHWAQYVQTFPDADPDHMWRALSAMGELFREAATVVGHSLGYAYPSQQDENVSAYLACIRDRSTEASEP